MKFKTEKNEKKALTIKDVSSSAKFFLFLFLFLFSFSFVFALPRDSSNFVDFTYSSPSVVNGGSNVTLWDSAFNSTGDSRWGVGSGDNESWNESWADQQYYQISNPFGYYNITSLTVTESQISDLSHTVIWDSVFNSTFDSRDSDTTYSHLSNFTDNILWTSAFNSTGDSRWGNVSGDNSSWNESWANLQYEPIGITESDISDLSHTVNTNAQTICSGVELLLGNGSCLTTSNWLTSVSWGIISGIPSGFADNVDNDTTYTHLSNFTNDLASLTDTNASTECSGSEVLLGNGSCHDSSNFGTPSTSGNTVFDFSGSKFRIRVT